MRWRWIVAAAAVVGLSIVGCKHADDGAQRTAVLGDGAEAPVAAHDPAPKEVPSAKVVITPPTGEPVTVNVEVVRDRRSIRRGLMYRQHLPPDQGMLFLMESEKVHTFWMKNTLIPLDMLFIGSDKIVAGVSENAEPLTTSQRYVDKPSLYVLEVNAGWAKAHNVGAGARVEFVGVGE